MIKQLIRWTAAAVLTGAAGLAHAAYPEKPITIFTPFAAGGTADILARMISDHLTKTWGQPVIVQNKAGAAGLIAMSQLMKSEPDGYTLSINSSGTASINPHLFKKPPYDTFKDFVPVTILVDLPFLLVVEKSSSIKNLDDYLAKAKSEPGMVTLGVSGVGSHQFLAANQLAALSGIKPNLIPYKGSAQQIVDLLGGALNSMLDNVATQVPLIQTDKVRPLAVSSAQRIPLLPDVPTFEEAGVRGFVSTPWFGLIAPGGTPADIVDKLQAEIASYFAQPETRRKLEEIGAMPAVPTPQETLVRLRAESVAFSEIIEQLNLPKQ